MTETVRESGSSAFYLSNDTFDAVAISVALDTEIEAVSRPSVFQRVRAIDEKHGVNESRRDSFARQKSLISEDVVNVVFLAEFSKKLLCENAICRRLKLCIE